MRRITALAIALAMLAVARPSRADRVIPPGREEAILTLLGRGLALPEGCALASASVERTRAIGVYHCADRERRVTLSSRVEGNPSIRQTDAFAITFDPPGHAAFEDALAASVHAHEATWVWVSSTQTARNSASARARTPIVRTRALWSILAALALLLATAAAYRAMRVATPTSTARRDTAMLAATGLALFVIARLRVSSPPAHLDTARDFLLAIDCHVSGCTTGPSAAPNGLQQGTLWPRILGALVRAGLDPYGVQTVLLASYVLGAIALAWTWRRTVSERGALVVATSFFAGSLLFAEIPVLWGPSLAPLPLAIGTAILVALVGGASAWFAPLAGISLAIATESHLVCAPLVVIAPAILLATSRSITAPVSMLASSLAAFALASRGTWLNNAHVVPWWLAIVAMGALFALALAARRRLRGATLDTRMRAALFAWSAVALVLAGGAAAIAPPGPFIRAALPALAPVALLAGAACAMATLPAVRVAVGALSGVLFAIAIARTSQPSVWTMRDAARIASVLHARGIDWAESVRHLAADDELRPALAPWDRHIARAPRGGVDDQAVVRVSTSDHPPAGVASIALESGAHAWIVRCEPMLDRARVEVCGASDCRTVETPHADEVVAADRAYPTWSALEGGDARDVRFSLRDGSVPAGRYTVFSVDRAWMLRGDDGRAGASISVDAPWPAHAQVRAVREFPARNASVPPLCAVREGALPAGVLAEGGAR